MPTVSSHWGRRSTPWPLAAQVYPRLLTEPLALADVIQPIVNTGGPPGTPDPTLPVSPSNLADTGNPLQNGLNLQNAINTAAPGAVIVCQAGVEYRRNFTLPPHAGAAITIRSTVGLPIGRRVSPALLSSMALLTTPTSTNVIEARPNANDWILSGVAVTTAFQYPNGMYVPNLIGQDAYGIGYGAWPRRLTFDRCLIYAREMDPLPYRSAAMGIAIDGEDITIRHCYIYNFTGWQYPSFQAGVTSISNGNPAVVTFAYEHYFRPKWGAPSDNSWASPTKSNDTDIFFFEGGTGAWAAVNGIKQVTRTDATHAILQNFDRQFVRSNVNTLSAGSYSGQSVLVGSRDIMMTVAVMMQAGPGPYTLENNYLEAYYTPLFSGGATSTWIDPAHQTTVTAVNSISQVVLGSVTDLVVGDLISLSAFEDQLITTAAPHPTAPATHTVLTTSTVNRFSADMALYPEGYAEVSGFTGAWAGANGKWGGDGNSDGHGHCQVVDATSIYIMVDSRAWGPVTGSGMKWKGVVKQPTGYAHVGKVTAINTSTKTVDYDFWGHQPQNTGGNGAGMKAVVGAAVQYRGRNLSGVTVLHNTLAVQRYWVGTLRNLGQWLDNSGQSTHGFWECKMSSNVTIRGNIFITVGGSLAPFDDLGALGINQANQTGSTPWVSNSNWLVEHNIFDHCSVQNVSFTEEYQSGTLSTGFVFRNNLGTYTVAPSLSLQGGDAFTFSHNTFRNDWSTSGVYTNQFLRTHGININDVIRDNVGWGLQYGYNVDPSSMPWTPTRDHNYLIDDRGLNFALPAGDVRVTGVPEMGFIDGWTADLGGDYHGYRLRPSSPGHLAASDGTDVGVDFAALDAALVGNDGLAMLGTVPPPPPFPAQGIVDNTTRANENPLSNGGFWSPTYRTNIQLVSNQARAVTAAAYSVFSNALTSSADCEFYVTVPVLPLSGGYLQVGIRYAPTTNTFYYFYCSNYSGSGDTWVSFTLGKTVNGVDTVLGVSAPGHFAAGQQLGMRATGNLIRGYVNGQILLSVNDASIPAAGRIGFWGPDGNSRLVNFGGGPF